MLGNVLILGDSYSTFEGYIPQGYPAYYSNADEAASGVLSVHQTWWHLLLANRCCRLVRNSSYSGSTVCNTGYDGGDYSEISFVGRLDKLIKEGFFESNPVDTVFIFGGTNDTWAGSPIGDERDDLYAVAPACRYLLRRLRGKLPKARILWILEPDLSGPVVGAILDACQQEAVQTIGLTDIEKTNGHPTARGMSAISRQIAKYLDACIFTKEDIHEENG